MGRTARVTEYYVRVDPRRIGCFGGMSVSDRLVEPDEDKRLDMYRDTCEVIVEQVKRHVDCVGSVTVENEAEDVCEFCGSSWTEAAESTHNGGCCDKDCDVYEAAEAAAGNVDLAAKLKAEAIQLARIAGGRES